ncbi:pilus assembly protein [Xenophilus sp. Marseille-Q4582]|uniref:pilus assembly protein n=1 Tax=Xenophilus sp. Marseille-Q4582 TaxID=2866600 RepID=UPI001CE46630|nr:PilC/PilY family type IV pilus protein [Xenophilus sp. Marseille-Q4582]
MKHRPCGLMRRTTLSLLIGGLALPQAPQAQPTTTPGTAAPTLFELAQYPAGTAARLPAPNVIVSVDDSGSMGPNGMATLRAALEDTFAEAKVPDGAIRLGWQAMTGCATIPAAGDCAGRNEVRVLDATHRANFMAWVKTLKTQGSTPSHRMYFNAGQYYRQAPSVNSPWASVPGTKQEPMLTCRRSYNLFMTDGGWNSTTSWSSSDTAAGAAVGNADGTPRTLGDGTTAYDPTDAQTRIYSDSYGSATLPTMADLAFQFWATDLQPTMANGVKPLMKETSPIVVSADAHSLTLQPFWNPRNNPATWQHMTTYTVGFNAAANWNAHTTPKFDGPDTWSGATYARLLLGLDAWTDPIAGNETTRMPELWHMALNGRGKFIPAPTAASLAPAFQDILNEIINDNTAPVTSTAQASMSLARTDTMGYTAGYLAEKWKGYVSASNIARGTGASSAGWGGQTTADKLDALTPAQVDERLVLSWREGSAAGGVDGPTAFRWASGETYLSTAQKAHFFAATEAESEGEARLNYLRGDRSRETAGNPLFRERASRQGDIVNSKVWYVAQPAAAYGFDGYSSFYTTHKDRLPMLYVGGNDGMLHGFSGVDGTEKIAYVPKGVIPGLRQLTQTGYNQAHRYFVDGSPFSGDVNWGSSTAPDWRTLLVGTLGAGGKGYFVLDVTRPGNTGSVSTPASNFTENQAASLVVMDKTSASGTVFADTAPEAYIGQITAPPVVSDTNAYKATQITRLNDGKWALVMGNGYNSTKEQPALLIQYIDGNDKSLKVIPVPASAAGNGNGLSAPRLVDLDGDGKTDVVYAGDLQGNLWKFDLLGDNAANWHVAFNNAPLYTASYTPTGAATGTRQPITAPPIVRANTRGVTGLMVAFGTGRNLTLGDRESTAVQSLYSVFDNTQYTSTQGVLAIDDAVTPEAVGTGVSRLVQQQITATYDVSQREFNVLSDHSVDYQATGSSAKKGWYLHLPKSRERVLDPITFYNNTHLLEVVSEIPATGGDTVGETCDPQSRKAVYYRTFINIMDGRPPSFQVVDSNGDGWFNGEDLGVSRLEVGKGKNPGQKYENVCAQGKAECDEKVNNHGGDDLQKPPVLSLRPSWRQLQ